MNEIACLKIENTRLRIAMQIQGLRAKRDRSKTYSSSYDRMIGVLVEVVNMLESLEEDVKTP